MQCNKLLQRDLVLPKSLIIHGFVGSIIKPFTYSIITIGFTFILARVLSFDNDVTFLLFQHGIRINAGPKPNYVVTNIHYLYVQ